MSNQTNDKLSLVKEKLNFIDLDFENIPEFFEKTSKIECKSIRENDFKKYKVYKYVDVRDIQILITPKNRLDSFVEKYKLAKKIVNYMNPKKEEDIPLQAEFITMLNNMKIEDINKVDEIQKAINKKLPYKVEYEDNYLWEIYYSEAYNTYFMLFPSEDSNYECLFYLLKKQIEAYKKNKEIKIFIPICYMDYTGIFLKKSEIYDLEDCLWLFTGDWPNIYEVFDKNNQPTIQIVGDTLIYDNLESLYKITLKEKEDAIRFYKFIKAMFILQSEIPHKYKFKTKIDRYGSLEFYYNNKKIKYEDLPTFIEKEYKKTIKNIQEIIDNTCILEKEIIDKQNIVKQKEKEYIKKEKEITLYLKCKKTFFGRIKYFFKHKKNKINDIKIEEENLSNNIEKETVKIEEKNYYNIEDLIKINKKYIEVDQKYKNIKLDIDALKNKIDMYERKINNANLYIKEIDKHNKSIFEFWKFTNKDEKQALAEGSNDIGETKNFYISKTFDINSEFEDFANKADKIQRERITSNESNSIYLLETNLFEQINLIKKQLESKNKIEKENKELLKIELDNLLEEAASQQELFKQEEYNIFGNLQEDNSTIKYLNGKKHRETEKNKFKILNITKNTTKENYIEKLKNCVTEIKKALSKNVAISNMPIYKITENELQENIFELFNIKIQNCIEGTKENKLYLYKINVKEGDNIVYLTNYIYYNNYNNTLPLGMDITDKVLLDMNNYKLELVNKDSININEQYGMYNKIKNLKVFEYNIVKNND